MTDAQPLVTPQPRAVAESLVIAGSGGRKVFQILVPGGCRHACELCPMRGLRGLPDEVQTADHLARMFLVSYRRGRCDGVFLTAGLAAVPLWAAERLIALAEVLRLRYGFQGYIHVKVPEGAAPGQVQRLLHLVDRLSYRPEPDCAPLAGGQAITASAAVGVPPAVASGRTGLAARRAAYPVEVTTAGRDELRSVPGIGGRTADRLLAGRAGRSVTAASLPLPARARGLVTVRGRLAGLSRQASLFDELEGRASGARFPRPGPASPPGRRNTDCLP